MGAPRGNDVVCASLGAGVGESKGLTCDGLTSEVPRRQVTFTARFVPSGFCLAEVDSNWTHDGTNPR